MKSLLISALIAAIVSSGSNFSVDNTAVMTGHVLNKYTENGVKYTTFETFDGNMWIVEGGKYRRGAKYTIIFDTQGTDDITDDTIVKIIRAKQPA